MSRLAVWESGRCRDLLDVHRSPGHDLRLLSHAWRSPTDHYSRNEPSPTPRWSSTANVFVRGELHGSLRPTRVRERFQCRTASSKLSTLEQMEREHMLRVIRSSNWKIGGPNGAAARLGMKRQTLAYRIRKLKIPLRPQ